MIGAILIVLLAGNESLPAEKPFFSKPLLLAAHRGGAALWPENTIEGYQQAVNSWPDILLEGDARMTADGHVMLLHDSRVDRTTDGTGEIAAMTLDQAKSLDAGYRFTPDGGLSFPYRGKGIRIPALKETLAAFPNSRFLIELKNQPGMAKTFIEIVREAKALERVVAASSNSAFMAELRETEPSLLRCYDMVEGLALLNSLRGDGWPAYQPVADMLAIRNDLVEKHGLTAQDFRAIRDKGIAVLVHTINEVDTMRKYLELGVTSILTDRPDLLADLIK